MKVEIKTIEKRGLEVGRQITREEKGEAGGRRW